MRDIYQYFDWFSCIVEDCGAESAEVDFEPDSSISGMIEGVIYFYDGSRLEVTERVKLERRRPVKTIYVYQYVRAGESVFRYDNAPHHPGLSNFPHHKHVGSKRLSAIEPSLNQILDEIAEHFADAPPSKPKRRRQSKRSGSN
jgi:hypothetical protein